MRKVEEEFCSLNDDEIVEAKEIGDAAIGKHKQPKYIDYSIGHNVIARRLKECLIVLKSENG